MILKIHVLVILLTVIAAGALQGCGRQETPAAKESPAEQHDHHDHEEHQDEVRLTAAAIREYGVQVEEARKQVLAQVFTVPARVVLNTDAMAHVGSALGGRVVEVKVKKGDVVKKGDELFVIESSELGEAQSEYLQRLMQVPLAEPPVAFAKEALERAKKLHGESQGISLTEVQRREGEYVAAQGALKAARLAVTGAENKMRLLAMDQRAIDALAKSGEISPRFVIHAPIAGQVLEREITLGEFVSPERDSLMVLVDLSTMWVIADVPEVRLREIASGSDASIRLVAAGGGEALKGKVSFIDPILDPATRSARMRIELDNKDGFLRQGMFANVEITANQGQPQVAILAVPEAAVQTVEGAPAIFVPVQGERNTFAKRAVTVGRSTGGMVPVLSGLKEGEKFVSVGSFLLKAELGKSGAAHEH